MEKAFAEPIEGEALETILKGCGYLRVIVVFYVLWFGGGNTCRGYGLDPYSGISSYILYIHGKIYT